MQPAVNRDSAGNFCQLPVSGCVNRISRLRLKNAPITEPLSYTSIAQTLLTPHCAVPGAWYGVAIGFTVSAGRTQVFGMETRRAGAIKTRLVVARSIYFVKLRHQQQERS